MFHSLDYPQDIVGIEFVSPSKARAFLDQVNDEYHSFNSIVLSEALAGVITDSEWIAHWGHTHFSWQSFYQANHGVIASLAAAQLFGETLAFQKRLREFIAEYEAMSGKVVPGGVSVDAPETGGSLEWYHWAAIAAGIGVTAFVAGKVL